MMKFVMAAMNGGKTTHLLQTVHSWKSRGFNVVLLKPKDDTRDANIKSRIGASAPVDIVIEKTDDLVDVLTKYCKNVDNVAMVVVDEAQFLTVPQVEDLFVFSTGNIPVTCYGLKADSWGNAWPGGARLMELAIIEELHMIRCRCGEEAQFNTRFNSTTGELITTGPKKVIEGSNSEVIYDPVCAKCFVELGGFTRKAPHRNQ